MTKAEPGWELYRSFLGVLEEGSLSGAARALGIAQPTVGRHVEALEQALGVALFTRSPSGFAPTEAALALGPHAKSIAASAAAMLRVAASQDGGVSGVVRISASEIVGVEVLPPILAALRARHPALVFELAVTNRVDDLLRREADIAVRMFRPSQGPLVAKRVGPVEVGLHAHPAYLERHGTPRKREDLAAHTLIGFDRETAFIRSVRESIGSFTRADFAFRTDSDIAQLSAIRSGFGIGFCQVGIGKRDGLVRLLPKQLRFELETWVAVHEDLKDSPRCRATFDGLVAGLGRYIRS